MSEMTMKQSLTLDSLTSCLPPRQRESYKGNYGRILVIAGAAGMGGAAILATSAAVYSGAGLVTAATAACHHGALHSRVPEAMATTWEDLCAGGAQDGLISAVDTILIGPGLSHSSAARNIFIEVLQHVRPQQTLVIDASALGLWKQLGLPPISAQVVITPHMGEWSALTNQPLSAINDGQIYDWLQRHLPQGILVLKSHQTTIYTIGQEGLLAHPLGIGNPGMAVGGMGDCLAGMIAGLVYQSRSVKDGVCLAVYLHSYIGDLIAEQEHIVLPHRLIERIPQTMRELFSPEA